MTLWIVFGVWVLGIPVAAYVIGYAEGMEWIELGEGEASMFAMLWPLTVFIGASIAIGSWLHAIGELAWSRAQHRKKS